MESAVLAAKRRKTMHPFAGKEDLCGNSPEKTGLREEKRRSAAWKKPVIDRD